MVQIAQAVCVMSREGAKKPNTDQHETWLEGVSGVEAERCNSRISVERANSWLETVPGRPGNVGGADNLRKGGLGRRVSEAWLSGL